MKKLITVTAVSSLLVAGCSQPVQSICNDASKYTEAISGVDAENPEFKAELLEDVAEAATEGNCPGYDTYDEN